MVDFRHTAPDSVPDVYFTHEYGSLDARFRSGSWATIAEATGTWQLPLVLTQTGADREALSPYGYAGIYISPVCTPTESAENWRLAQELLREMGVVSMFLRFSPLDPDSSAAAALLPGLTSVRSGETYINKTSDAETLWTSMEGRARTAIRRARGVGMTAQVRPASPGDVAVDSPFRVLYETTMQRVEAGHQYFFEDDYYVGLTSIPSSPLYVVEVAQDDQVVAASLVMRHGDLAHYHLSGSNPDAAKLGANALLVWTMLEWCCANGISRCHLGGGLREGDGLAKFKRSFGGSVSDFHTGRIIVSPDRYESLTTERARSLGVSPQDLASSGYFPAFRAGA
jgi:serine/alanine adding enzyme